MFYSPSSHINLDNMEPMSNSSNSFHPTSSHGNYKSVSDGDWALFTCKVDQREDGQPVNKKAAVRPVHAPPASPTEVNKMQNL